MIRVGSIVLRVDNLPRQTEFWSAALDYVARPDDGDDFVLLRPRTGGGPNLSLDRVRSILELPPRIHLDLYTGYWTRASCPFQNGSRSSVLRTLPVPPFGSESWKWMSRGTLKRASRSLQ